MELLKQNIHMERSDREGSAQVALEDDRNLPENKPDINTLCMEKGNVVIEEVRPGTDGVTIKGKLCFSVLYHTLEEGSRLSAFDGKVPFEEKVRVEGMTGTEQVHAAGQVDDLTISIINSRKLSIQGIITLQAAAEELYDQEVPVGVLDEGKEWEKAQVRQIPMEVSQVTVCKRDVMRIKEELTLPGGHPNLGELLWKSVEPGELSFRLGDEKVTLQGECRVFVLYYGENESREIQRFETTVPITQELPCTGCREGSGLDVSCQIGQWELTPRPDLDGEQRVLALEATLDLKLKVFEEKTMNLVTDLYGVTTRIQGEKKKASLQKLLRCVTGRTNVSGRVKIPTGSTVLQLLHSECPERDFTARSIKDGIALQGNLGLKILYIAGEDDRPYGAIKTFLPFEYTLDIPGMEEGDPLPGIRGNLEHLTVTMLDGEELDVKATLCYTTTALKDQEAEVISKVTCSPLDAEELASLPSMVIYVVKPGDHLWNIGKKYYVPVQKLMELNELQGQDLYPGQKLLIVKGE